MSLCPVDGKPCIDDLCHGGGCIRSPYEAMLEICAQCGCAYDGEYIGAVSNLCEECNGEFEDDCEKWQ